MSKHFVVALLGCMCLDYVFALLAAWLGKSLKTAGGHLSSSVAVRGIVRKCGVLGVVALSYIIDYVCTTDVVAPAVCIGLIVAEGISLLETLAGVGVPIPAVLRRALEAMAEDGAE